MPFLKRVNIIILKRFYQHIKISRAIIAFIAATLSVASCYALDAEHYAQNSVLSQGRWVKIKVNTTGMQLISNADLKAMGFSNADKVNVYGTGGGMVREALTADMPDDLPLLPSIRTPKGIVFFGVDNTTWTPTSDGLYSHVLNPYCGESFYFVSDREIEKPENSKALASPLKGAHVNTSFTARLEYERDIQAPSQEGRMLLGEDFRTNKSQKFNFSLPGMSSEVVTARVVFGAKTTNGSSSLIITANGSRLPSTPSDKIDGCNDSEFIKTTSTTKSFNVDSDNLSLSIDYSYSGALFTARLDHIEVFYDRNLNLSSGELHFYDTFNGETVEITGCTTETQIWDVTDPCKVMEVDFSMDGNNAYFTPQSGYREYVAFNPSAISRSITRSVIVKNQDIHSLPTPDMVIVAYAEYASAANRIAKLHEETDGFNVLVLTPESIYNEFSGGHTDVSAFRKMLKMWYDRGGERHIRYCLLLGRGSYDTKMVSTGIRGAGYRPLPLWQSPTGISESSAFSTDDIIGMLDDTDEDSFNMRNAQMQVAVGRLPVTSVKEAEDMAAKLEKYIKNPTYGAWRNRVMLIADDQDNALHLIQTEDVYKRLSANAPHYQYEKVYLDAYPLVSSSVGMTYPAAKERMMRLFNEGVIYTNYIGHASPTSWTHEKLLTWNDIISFTNPNLTFYYGATCSFGTWDADNISGAEKLVLNPTAGFIGAICPSRTVYMSQNGTLSNYMADWMLTSDSDNEIYRVGDVFVNAKNSYVDDNKLRYCLISDPALRIPKPSRQVVIESINDVNITTSLETPELKALSKVRLKGYVATPDGSPIDEFNGTVMIDLYDAEKAVVTLGNGEAGAVKTYNDRQTKLASVSTKVVNGQWEATLMMPAEIEGNYSPARISAYAWSDKGKEAQGSTESLYVYGYEEMETPDTKGPEIKTMYLNYPDFTEGMMVNANPVVHASFSDESGINLSEAGIGHKMSITLDDDKIFDDVYMYYTPDPENPLGGYLAYPISDLGSGEHTIKLTVYDNANNASSKSLTFSVGVLRDPVIRNLATDVNPASTSVVFSVAVDQPNTKMNCRLEVFELSGRRVWSSDNSILSDMQGGIQTRWDLKDGAGRRVARGIYLYRATIETPDGMYSSQTKKLAVTAQ